MDKHNKNIDKKHKKYDKMHIEVKYFTGNLSYLEIKILIINDLNACIRYDFNQKKIVFF
jgi:hypothetical protein